MKKRILNIIFVIVLSFVAMVSVQATEVSDNTLPHFVDDADLLDTDEEQKLEEKLASISDAREFDVVIVTIDSLGEKTATEYADDFFDYNGYGKGSANDGILFLISMEYRDWAISTTGFGIRAFTNAGQSYIIDEIRPYLGENNFNKAFDKFANLCDKFIKKAQSGDAYGYGNMPKEIIQPSWMLLALVIGFVIAFIAASISKLRLKSVHWQTTASNYIKHGTLDIKVSKDLFLYSKVDRRAKPKDNPSSSSHSGSGSRTHRSSSGMRHGGSSGKF